jgi:hypothetical protein
MLNMPPAAQEFRSDICGRASGFGEVLRHLHADQGCHFAARGRCVPQHRNEIVAYGSGVRSGNWLLPALMPDRGDGQVRSGRPAPVYDRTTSPGACRDTVDGEPGIAALACRDP